LALAVSAAAGSESQSIPRSLRGATVRSAAFRDQSAWRTLSSRVLLRPAMPKFFIKTYGCQMNERDSEQVAYSLIARGYERVEHEAEADVVLLNTCSVRDMADQKALGKMGMLGRIAKERPHVVFGFLGCMAQTRGASLLENFPHVDLIVGTQKFHRVADYVAHVVARKNAVVAGVADLGYSQSRMDDPRFSIVDIGEEPGSQETIREQQLAKKQATAFVSIMQGCNMRCTFCIVPQTRGPERSRAISEIVREVRTLVEQGVKEVALLGQIVNLYGRHEIPPVADPRLAGCKKSAFVQLLEAVHEIDGLQRLRFTSPHPIGFREDLIEALARLTKLADHVHLPLQSGSNKILKAMHRAYTAEKYSELVQRIRRARNGIAITTDIIVGFPGETEGDYHQTRKLVEQIQFDNAFVFRYSPRRDTPAADMPEQVPERIKEERNHDLLALINQSARRANERLVGRNVEVLCEGPSKINAARLTGRTRTNKVVVFEGNDDLVGETLDITIKQANGFSLYGMPAATG
jgi:tRNA-2-methylthio-N6-dimethylallyladenosine synthase